MDEMLPQAVPPPIPDSPDKRKQLVIGILLLLLLVGIGIYAWKTTPRRQSGLPPSAGSQQTTQSQNTPSTKHTYMNEQYNFMFQYPEDIYYGKILANQFQLGAIGDNIIITENIFNSDGTTTSIPTEYRIYDASPTDKDNMLGWWKSTHTTDFGNQKVPDGYDTLVNGAPFVGCIKADNPTWQLPPALEVLPKGAIETDAQEAAEAPGATEEPIDPTRVIYLYYDFGKPFILRVEEPNNGGCGAKDSYLVLTSIRKLH